MDSINVGVRMHRLQELAKHLFVMIGKAISHYKIIERPSGGGIERVSGREPLRQWFTR